MAVVTDILEAIRRFGKPTQRSALKRLDQFLEGKNEVGDTHLATARSDLGSASIFGASILAPVENVEPLSDDETRPIIENAGLVERFITTFAGDLSHEAHFLDRLDLAFGQWMETSDRQSYSDEEVIEVLGAAFGQFCVEQLEMDWVRITDADGTAIAVQGRKKMFRGFPCHTIEKRLPTREHGFFKPVFISLEEFSRNDWKPTPRS